jgi:hypothetical protein
LNGWARSNGILLLCSLNKKKRMFAQTFRAVAALLSLYEVEKDGWHHAAVFGHTKASMLYPFTMAEAELLWGWDIIVISQLFNTNDLTGMLDRAENDVLTDRLQQYPLLRHKLHLLAAQLRSNNFLDKTSVGVTTLALLFRKDHNISQKYKKTSQTQPAPSDGCSSCLRHSGERRGLCP